MKVLIVAALFVVSNYCLELELVGEKLDQVDENVEQLPRQGKTLIGTFPFTSHGKTYNPRARQPLDSLKEHIKEHVDDIAQHHHHHHSQFHEDQEGQRRNLNK